MVIGRSARVRRRLDSLRTRFEGRTTDGSTVRSSSSSSSLEESVERLALAVDRHFTRQADTRVTADRLVDALDVIPQGIVLADGQGDVVFRNRAAQRFNDARHSEALVESAIGELVAAAVAGVAEVRTLELYGPPRRALQLRAEPLVAADGDVGAPGGAFLMVEDVSERQRLDAVRRDFVANISHELKTPVGALGVLAEALVDEDQPEVIARLADRMHREAFRVARTIDDLLQLSQIEASEQPLQEPVAIGAVMAEAVDRARSGADLRDIQLVVLEPDQGVSVLGDRRQLASALANLCENAVKYSDDGAEVSVTARTEGSWVEIDVADQGIGIPEADLERVFERFYRVDRARSRDTGGTGLGLSIVRHVAQNHGGEVSVRSREGEGSTFTLRLPAADAATGTESTTRTPRISS